ncbi:endonuclease domain-containing protein [Schumannella luteola]
MRLRRWRVSVQTQVVIAGVGRVDVLIGDRLVLELDGYGFHATGESFESDRRRDLELARLDYRVIRLSYRQVMYSWEEAESVLLALIRRGEHRWPRRSFSG